jgi:hypothetical protein
LILSFAWLNCNLALAPEQCMAFALWALHTCVFGRYSVTPRLALISPVRGCGKTTALILLEALVSDPYRSDHVTAAAVYHTLYRVPVMATLGRFPKARESDSTWRTKEVRHVGSDTVAP